MAHVGKTYRVAFRRDYNLNVANNNIGWPKFWNFFPQGITGGPGAAILNHGYICGPDIYPSINSIGWSSAATAVGPFRARANMLTTINAPGSFTYTFTLDVQNVGIILIAQNLTAGINVPGWGPPSLAWNVVAFDPAWFGPGPPVIGFVHAVQRGWTDPLPH